MRTHYTSPTSAFYRCQESLSRTRPARGPRRMTTAAAQAVSLGGILRLNP